MGTNPHGLLPDSHNIAKCTPELRSWLDDMALDIIARNADEDDVVYASYLAAMYELLADRPNMGYIRSLCAHVLKRPLDQALN